MSLISKAFAPDCILARESCAGSICESVRWPRDTASALRCLCPALTAPASFFDGLGRVFCDLMGIHFFPPPRGSCPPWQRSPLPRRTIALPGGGLALSRCAVKNAVLAFMRSGRSLTGEARGLSAGFQQEGQRRRPRTVTWRDRIGSTVRSEAGKTVEVQMMAELMTESAQKRSAVLIHRTALLGAASGSALAHRLATYEPREASGVTDFTHPTRKTPTLTDVHI
jgi:hypothetical protein